jgi:hypothetical protein
VPAPQNPQDALRIRELRLACRLTGDASKAPGVEGRIRKVLAQDLGAELDGALAPLRAHGDGLWFIRTLSFDVDLDLGFSDQELALRFAKRLGGALERHAKDARTRDACYFATPAHYLAQFVRELARGTAWNAWYFAAFDGLRALPNSMALRTALLDDPRTGAQALSALEPGDLAAICSALTPGDARCTLEGLARENGEGSPPNQATVAALCQALECDAGSFAADPGRSWNLALLLFARLGAAESGLSVQRLCLVSAALALATRASPERTPRGVLDAAELDDPSALYAKLGPELSEQLRPLLELPRALRSELVERVADGARRERANELRFTRFGGVFLLLTGLSRMPLEGAVASWPEPPLGTSAALLRLLVLSRCFGRELAVDVMHDGVVRELAGVPARTSPAVIAAWCARLGEEHALEALRALGLENPAIADALDSAPSSPGLPAHIGALLERCALSLLRAFARRLPGFGASSPDYVRKSFLSQHASVRVEANRWVVTLERAPMNVILAMSGVARGRVTVPWWPGVTLELHQEA